MIIENTEIVDYQSCKEAYANFISTQETLIYPTQQYLDLIAQFVGGVPKLMLSTKGEEIQGAIPFFEKSGRFGTIVNSLPFYGSNGGCITKDPSIKTQLLHSIERYIRSNEVDAATIINNPLTDPDGYDLQCDFLGSRIGQYTFLNELDQTNLDESLLNRFHYKTRNMVRKAIKSNIKITKDNSQFDYLIKQHQKNMSLIGGMQKTPSFFNLLEGELVSNKDYNLFVAHKDGKTIAALLVLYHKGIVEYYTPVIEVEYRSYQPMSLLIFESMKMAVKNGYKCWNWGGTWESQESVYRFKKRWGSVDKPYHYYTFVNNMEIRNCSPEELLKEYPYFFVLPFDELLT